MLYELELFVAISLENFEFYFQIIGIISGPKQFSKSILIFAKVHLFDAS